MSELRVGTISDEAGTGPATLTGQTAATSKARSNQGASATGDLNIASVTDNGVGDYTFTLSNNYDAADYSALGSADPRGTGQGICIGVGDQLTSGYNCYCETAEDASGNDEDVSVAGFGDLA